MNIKQSNLYTPRNILLVSLAGFVFLQSIYPLIDFDAWWHLKTGQYIWQTKSIPCHDIFSYTIYGKPWVTFEWLAQVIFYGLYALGGVSALILFKAFVAVLILWGMILTARKTSSIVMWVLFAAVFIVMRDALRERPQIFTYLLSIIFAATLRRSWKPGLYFLPVLQALWVNLHGMAGIIGLCIIFTYVCFDKEMSASMRVYLTVGCSMAMFLSPNTYHIFVYLYTFFSQGFGLGVNEYLPTRLIGWFIPFYILAAVVSVSFALPGKRKFTDIIIVFGTLSTALMANRNTALFLILSAPIAAERYSDFLSSIGLALYPEARHFRRIIKNTVAAALAAALFFGIFWYVRTPLDFRKLYPFELGFRNPCMYAAEFISFCDEHGLKGNLFNDYSFGGYLIWRLWPERKVFVDGRLVEFGLPFVREAWAYDRPAVWDDLESKYHFTAAVVSNYQGYMSKYLDSRRDWFLVYWDDNALVYFKNVPGNNDLIKRFRYDILRPGLADYSYLLQYPGKSVLFELDRALAFEPNCVKAKSMKTFVQRYQNEKLPK